MRSACLVGALLLAVVPLRGQQRLFVAVDRQLFELQTDGPNSGRLVSQTTLSPCDGATAGPLSILRGLYLLWLRPGGACVFDVRSGAVRTLEVAGQPSAVVTSDRHFRVVFAERERLQMLGAFDASPVVTALPTVLPQVMTLASVSDDGRRVIAVQSDAFFTGAPAARVFTIDGGSGAIVHAITLTPPLLIGAVATDASGRRAYLTVLGPNEAIRGVHAIDVATGSLLASNTAVRPFDRRNSRFSGPFLLVDAEAGELAVVTDTGTARLDQATLKVKGTLDLPRTHIPIRPGFDQQFLQFGLHLNDATGTYVAVESEGQSWSYYPGRCLRNELRTVDGASGRLLGTADLAAIHGAPLCGLVEFGFMIAAPPAPKGFSAVTSYPSGYPQFGWGARLTWEPSPGATHYTIEAGNAPGRADVARFDVGGTSFQAANLPPSLSVYVTVRAVGIGGQGPRTAPAPLNRP